MSFNRAEIEFLNAGIKNASQALRGVFRHERNVVVNFPRTSQK
jgi:hypothetical protein